VGIQLSCRVAGDEPEPEITEADRSFDAFAGGYPVPPMPGQSLGDEHRTVRPATASTTSTAHRQEP
jgi:NADH-quinone oxidoreductase subunit H